MKRRSTGKFADGSSSGSSSSGEWPPDSARPAWWQPPITVPDEILEELARQLRDAPPVSAEIPAFAAFTLCAALQLAWRHPGLSELQREIVEKATRDLQDAIGFRCPAARELLAHGWDRSLDDLVRR